MGLPFGYPVGATYFPIDLGDNFGARTRIGRFQLSGLVVNYFLSSFEHVVRVDVWLSMSMLLFMCLFCGAICCFTSCVCVCVCLRALLIAFVGCYNLHCMFNVKIQKFLFIFFT